MQSYFKLVCSSSFSHPFVSSIRQQVQQSNAEKSDEKFSHHELAAMTDNHLWNVDITKASAISRLNERLKRWFWSCWTVFGEWHFQTRFDLVTTKLLFCLQFGWISTSPSASHRRDESLKTWRKCSFEEVNRSAIINLNLNWEKWLWFRSEFKCELILRIINHNAFHDYTSARLLFELAICVTIASSAGSCSSVNK